MSFPGSEQRGRNAGRQSGCRRLPAWVRPADGALAMAAEKVRLIRAVTPQNVVSELSAVERSFMAGAPRVPAFRYDPRPVPSELCHALEKLARFVEGQGALGAIYAARALELSLESEMIAAVGTPTLSRLAALRFVGTTERDRVELAHAGQLALQWALLPPQHLEEDAEQLPRSDSTDPRSLLSVMMAEVGRRRLPIRVIVQPGLASLAATGDGVILVAAGKQTGKDDVERTVLHEIEGHVMPRVRAATHSLGIFAVGTARGVDDQEGRALLLERAMGYLGPARRRELGLRHLAAQAVLDGADFIQVVEKLAHLECAMHDALRIAARVHRGGAQSGGGIAREIIYLPAMLRVERTISTAGYGIERLMASGRVAADAAQQLLEYANPSPEIEDHRVINDSRPSDD